MIPKKSHLLHLMFLCLLWARFAPAQSAAQYQWRNPADEKFAVVGGQAWPTEAARFYDRFPARAEKSVRKEVWDLSRNSAGEWLGFTTNAANIIVRYTVEGTRAFDHMPATGVSGLDLYAAETNSGWQWASGTRRFGDTIEYRFNNLAPATAEQTFRLYLPLYNTIRWLSVGVAPAASFRFLPKPVEKPVVLYGTSILQGGCASRPGLAWTNILDRKLDYPLINLGFSGNGRLEPSVVDLINELDARLYVIDCLPNLADSSKYSRQDIRQRIFNATEKLQGRHPQTPILFAEHCCGIRANMDASVTKNYQWVNEVLKEAFAMMQSKGVKNIYLLTAEAIGFDTESTVDGTHPNDIGMMKYAIAYEKIIREILQEGKATNGKKATVRKDN